MVSMYAQVLSVTCSQIGSSLNHLVEMDRLEEQKESARNIHKRGYCEQKQGQIGRIAHTERNIFLDFPRLSPLWIIYKQYSQFLENILTPGWVEEKYY